MNEQNGNIDRKPYNPPEILEELDLETSAGSPLGAEEFEGLPFIP